MNEPIIKTNVDMFEDSESDAEDTDDHVANLISSNDHSQQMQIGLDFDSTPRASSSSP